MQPRLCLVGAHQVLPALAGILLQLHPAPLASAAQRSQCVSSNRMDGDLVGYDSVTLVPSGIPGGLMGEFRAVYGEWNTLSCNGIEGDRFPYLGESAGGRVVHVRFHLGFNPRNDRSCGNFSGSTVNLYSRARTEEGHTSHCDRPDIFRDNVAHELGHLLGLQDRPVGCSNYIMSQTAFTAAGSYVERSIQTSECRKVAKTNTTPREKAQQETIRLTDRSHAAPP